MRILSKIAASLCGLAVAASVAAPAAADWPRKNHNGRYRGAPIQVYRVPSHRPNHSGYVPRGQVRLGNSAPTPRIYVPPAKVYYGPPGGYYPPML